MPFDKVWPRVQMVFPLLVASPAFLMDIRIASKVSVPIFIGGIVYLAYLALEHRIKNKCAEVDVGGVVLKSPAKFCLFVVLGHVLAAYFVPNAAEDFAFWLIVLCLYSLAVGYLFILIGYLLYALLSAVLQKA